MARYTPLIDVLYRIANRDPDSDDWRSSTPSDAEYEAHKTWAIERYGLEAWHIYTNDNWIPISDV